MSNYQLTISFNSIDNLQNFLLNQGRVALKEYDKTKWNLDTDLFKELGISSLEAVTLYLLIEKKLRDTITLDQLYESASIRKLSDRIWLKINERSKNGTRYSNL
ncbi:hypothetical protein ABK040_014083 [Willaertia magna]